MAYKGHAVIFLIHKPIVGPRQHLGPCFWVLLTTRTPVSFLFLRKEHFL